MVKIKWTNEELRYITVFETYTGVNVKDVIVQGDVITFFIEEGELGKSIGKGGKRLRYLENILGKKIRVVELSDNPERFVMNFVKPARVSAIYISQKSDGTKVLNIVTRDKGIVRRKMRKLKELLDKYFNINEVAVI